MKLDRARELSIRYHADTDTLVLRNGVPSGNGETVAKHLVAYLNDEDEVTGFVLEHAAELLRPYLFPGLQERTTAETGGNRKQILGAEGVGE